MPTSSMHFITLSVKHETAFTILHEGQQTEILEQGPEIDNQEAAGFIKHFEQLLEKLKQLLFQVAYQKD